MSALQTHAPKIVVAVVAAGCAVLGIMEYSSAQARPQQFVGLNDDVNKLKAAMMSKRVSDNWKYGGEAANKLKYAELQGTIIERAGKSAEGELPARLAYQMPARPVVDSSGRPKDQSELTQHQSAEMGEITGVTAEGDHGRVIVAFKLPQKMKYLEPVRAEIFKGLAPDKIETSAPYATVEFGPEVAVAAEEAATPATSERTAEPATESSGAARRRAAAERNQDDRKAPKREPVKKAAEEIPAEFADVKVFSDTRVDPKRTYYYKLRLVCRMTVQPERAIETKDSNGIVSRITIVHAPKDAQTVQGKSGSNVLYATKLTDHVSATPPSNFEIRLAGTSGKIDPEGTPDFKRSKEYKGTFALRVWVIDAQEWHNKTIESSPDEKLKGTILYKDATTKENKSYDFDAGYKLVEIKEVMVTPEIVENVVKVDAEGNMVMDPKTKQPVKEEVRRKGQPIPNQVAILEDVATGKLEEFPKRADFAARKKSLEYYNRILEEQEKHRKIEKDKMDKLKTRLKEADAAREAERAAKAATDAATQQQPGFGAPRTSP